MPEFHYFKNLKITTKFVLYFLIIALLPLALATYLSYNNARGVLEEEMATRLFAIANNKANQIESYLREKEKDVTQIPFMLDIASAMEEFDEAFRKQGTNSPEYVVAKRKFSPFLSYYQTSHGYGDILLISSDGYIIFSSKGKKFKKPLYEMASKENFELANVFIATTKSLKTRISNFEYSSKDDNAFVYIAIPVLSEGNFIGTLVAQLSNVGISEFVKDYTGLGETGETAIVTKVKDYVVFTAPLRFDPNATFKKKISIGSNKGLAVQKAVQGKKGAGVSVDYKGEKVLAVWRYLPSFRLGIVVKMNTTEIFAPANRLRNTLLIISMALLALVVVMAVVVAQSISSPKKELMRTSGVITQGDLSERAKVTTKDEIGELAHSFNLMTDSLVEAKANVEKERGKLVEQKNLLEKVNKELDSFVYTVSHDLHAPLRAISAFASFLDEDYKNKLDKEGKENVDEIRKGANRMNDLISDLLTLSRISRVQNPYEDIDANKLISSVAERLKFDIKENKVDLKIQKNMPIIHCDRIKISEVFLNLINNAIKFSSKNNKETPRVEMGYRDKDKFHEFFIRDNGIGIDPRYHKDVFGIFKRIQTSDQFEGTGAGLTIVKRVINDHDGKIWIESELGKGATFYFTIPKALVKKKKLGEILIEEGAISEEELKKALKEQQNT